MDQDAVSPPHAGFWTISSFRVGVQGDVAVAEAHVKVSGSRCTDIERTPGEDAESADAAGGAGVSQDQSGFTRLLEWDHQPFPWEMATAVSDKVFDDGVHEFLVEVGGTGLLGFCDASFTEQRTNIGRHWLNEHNWNRTWVLHSAGYFANGNVRDANVKNARFTAGDRILIKLNFFNEAAEFYRDSGGDTGGEEPRYLGSTNGICIPVRLGFQMFHHGSRITLIKYEDQTGSMPAVDRAAGYLARGQLMHERATKIAAVSRETAAEQAQSYGAALQSLDEAARLFSALQDSVNTNVAMEKWNEVKELKKVAEALKF